MNFKQIITLIVFLLSLPITGQQFSKADVLSDLKYLKSSLEEAHFNLYGHVTKAEFDKNYLAVRSEIQKDSLSLFEITNLFQKMIAKANNAHTTINFPVQAYYDHMDLGGTNFPLEIVIENGKALIRKNWSTNANITIGSELKSINGSQIEQILRKIYTQIPAERLYFKNALLESFSFPRYYWQVFKEAKEFEVEIEKNGVLTKQKINSIKAVDYETERYNYDIMKMDWKFEKLSNSIGYLRPGKFNGDLSKYKSFIDSAFIEINNNKLSDLIIDLRNNPGGDDTFGDYMVSYFADRPFKWHSRFQLKSSAILKDYIRKHRDTTKAYAKSILNHKDGEIYDYNWDEYQPQKEEKRYKGNIYVLVNRHSYSQSTVTSAQIQDYGFGTIVGEETAEFPNLYASIFEYKLPKTEITVKVPKGKIQRVSGIDNGTGLIPDILINDELSNEKDEILEKLLKRIKTE
ncbi:S41 family peptidase [Winogradskyella aquimaris]|uniref:S41 family peptidase n=1 Tax=Winogradskyella aquimaris TaxID=864074 RepID=A0ABU5EQI7_9FLAO|nr:S41 family peptidase [Winogradskyella aquimaris]MDY2588326.1 S41 family peptidase [Winogradskyella aquimaris]